jgi:hypothetical protein
MKDIHAYDMDGTIVCSMHRYRTVYDNGVERIDLPYWRANECHARRDSLLPLAKQYQADRLDTGIITVIATARHIQEPDLWFIRNILGMPDYIVCRKSANDSRGGADIKIAGLSIIARLAGRIGKIHFWEDNQSYLDKVCAALNAVPHFVPSLQGH